MFSTYHMTNPVVFYNKEDQWEIPAIDIDGNPQLMQPYYTIMRLPGEDARRVHPDAAVHAGAQGQPGRVDGRAIRSRAIRAARGVRVSATDDRVRAAPDHRAHQSGPGDLAADHAVEPAGLAGDSGHAARHSGRRSAAVRAAAVPAGVRRQNSGAEPRHRRLQGSDRDGADARRRARAHLRRRRWRPRARGGLPSASSTSAAPAPAASSRRPAQRRRAPMPCWWNARASTTSARCRRSATATGRSTARRSSCWARRFEGCRNDAARQEAPPPSSGRTGSSARASISCRRTAVRPIARPAIRRRKRSSGSRARTSSDGRSPPRAPPARSTSASTARSPARCSRIACSQTARPCRSTATS